jgi:hypothetical protein
MGKRSPAKGSPSGSDEWPKKQDVSDGQKDEMAALDERRRKRRIAVPFDARTGKDGALQVAGTTTDAKLNYERLLDMAGTRSDAWMDHVVSALANISGGTKDGSSADTLKQGGAFLNGVGPRDEIEAALAVQMFAMHRMTATASQRAGAAEMRDQYRDYSNIAIRAARTFAAQLEALAKLRSGGKQQVEVRYVYVDARGGQNIIGSHVGPRGGGASDGFGHQPHVPGLAFAPSAPVWSPDPAGDLVPAAGNEGQKALPAARWQESGSAEGAAQRSLSDGPLHAGD